MGSETRPFVLVAGCDRFGLAVVYELIRRGAEVVVVASHDSVARYEFELQRLGVRSCSGASHSEGVLAHAELERATSLVLTADDDADNIDAAITARRMNPTVRIVTRVFAADLAAYLHETLGDVIVLSVSQVAAPIFAELALRAAESTTAPAAPRGPRARWPHPDRTILVLAGVFVAIFLFGILFFRAALGLSAVDAAYFVGTTVSTTGYGDISLLRESALTKLMGLVLMFSGAGLLAVFYGFVSSWFVQRRLEEFEGRVPVRGRGHVVVCGAGNVGFRVAERLRATGERVVVIERDANSHNAATLRLAGYHVILADATSESTLRLARVERARIVLALIDDDTGNLRIARLVRDANPAVPVVLRIVSAELATHVDAHASGGRMRLLSPIAVAAERFAEAALSARPQR